MAGFFFVHAFLTGVKQNYARKHRMAIDTIAFDFTCLPRHEEGAQAPEDGAYVRGMFVEGARWDYDSMRLEESLPKVGVGLSSRCSVLQHFGPG
jgi:dynein heavy chain, axonemal